MLLYALKALVSVPLSLFLLAGLGAVLWRRKRRAGPWLVGLAAAALVLLSIPVVAGLLMRSLQTIPALADMAELEDADAIVVLAGDYRPFANEFDGPSVGPLTLERVRYGARLAKASELPVLVTGGVVARGSPSIADAMRRVLQGELGVRVRWVEETSTTTWENAQHSAKLLGAHAAGRIALVTHAWHMPRALQAFEAAGFDVLCAPTAFESYPQMRPRAFLPSANALHDSSWAVHEWLGRLWYALQ